MILKGCFSNEKHPLSYITVFYAKEYESTVRTYRNI